MKNFKCKLVGFFPGYPIVTLAMNLNDLEGQMTLNSIFLMEIPIFYDGFEKSGNFFVWHDLDHDLDLAGDLDDEVHFDF